MTSLDSDKQLESEGSKPDITKHLESSPLDADEEPISGQASNQTGIENFRRNVEGVGGWGELILDTRLNLYGVRFGSCSLLY